MPHRPTIALVAALLLAATAAAVEDYAVDLSPAPEAGEVMELAISVRRTMHATIKRPDREDEVVDQVSSWTCIGTATLLALDEKGKLSAYQLRVAEFTARGTDDEEPRRLIEPGAVVTACRGEEGEAVYLVGEDHASKEVAFVIELCFGLPRRDSTFQQVFGSEKRRAVGESWSIDRDQVVKDMAEVGLRGSVEDLEGTTTLSEVLQHAGREHLAFDIALTWAGVTLADKPWSDLDHRGTMTMRHRSLMATEEPRYTSRSDQATTLHVEAKNRPDA